MGYLVKPTTNNFPVLSTSITIPEADVLTLGSKPYTLLPEDVGINYILISAFLQIDKTSTIAYTGFTHIYLTDNATLKYSLIEMNSVGNQLNKSTPYVFALNMTNPPNRFGIRVSSNKPIKISLQADPSAGNGDMTVTLYYIEVLDI